MDFIIDAQLPPSLSSLIKSKGHNCIHASELIFGNDTSDSLITKISLQQKRIVITKDNDFYHSYILKKEPHKLIFIRVGNMKKNDLKNLFERNFEKIINAISSNSMIELTNLELKILY